jgi:hypothetical protein
VSWVGNNLQLRPIDFLFPGQVQGPVDARFDYHQDFETKGPIRAVMPNFLEGPREPMRLVKSWDDQRKVRLNLSGHVAYFA